MTNDEAILDYIANVDPADLTDPDENQNRSPTALLTESVAALVTEVRSLRNDLDDLTARFVDWTTS